MRIRYVLYNAYSMGGTTRTVVNQANALCAEHDVEIATVYRSREKPGFWIDPRVKMVAITDLCSNGTPRGRPFNDPQRLMRKTRRFRTFLDHGLDKRFRRWDPEMELRVLRYFWAADDGLLVTTRPGLNLMAARMAPRRLIRVAQDHMNLATYKPRLREAILRAYPRFDAVTVLTERDRQDYQQALAGTGTPVVCIPNGVPPRGLAPAALDAKVLVAAGRLSPQKGFDLLLDAFALVSARHPDWQLWIFGSGDWQPRLAQQIERLGLTGRAHLKGLNPELDAQLAAASVYVLSSRFEGLPMVLLEAMTAGLPVVAFDCPTGPAEIVEHGRTGLLVPPKDVPALAEGMCALIEDPARRRAMGAAALEAARGFSITTVAARWSELFAELATGRRADAPHGSRRSAASH